METKTNKTSDPKKVLSPRIDVTTEANLPNVPKGKVYVVMVKPDGTEKPGSGFTVGESTYDRVYAGKPEFRLKKKHSDN